MNRREVIKSVGLIVGGVVVGADAFLSGCSTKKLPEGLLNEEQINLMEEIAETILPATENSPGAKDAQVGPFINRIVSNFYTVPEQCVFSGALFSFEKQNFVALTAKEKEAYLIEMEAKTKAYPTATYTNEKGESFETRAAYIMIKQLSIWAYLSAEVVARTNFNYLPVPGKVVLCVEANEQTKPMYYSPHPGAALRQG